MALPGSDISDLFDDIDWDRIKMGRFSEGDEKVMEQIVRGKGTKLFHSFSRGRYTTDLRQIGFLSSRPSTADGRETFIFRHDTMSKRRGREVPEGRVYVRPADGRPLASISDVGALRRDIYASVGGKSVGHYVNRGEAIPKGMEIVPDNQVRDQSRGMRPGGASRRQGYIERKDAVEESEDGVASSVGNIADEKRERTRFWRAVEERERANGRVLSSVIAELPFEAEIGPEGRLRIVEAFGREIGEMGLRWHGVVHNPDDHSDDRNFHMHLIYHDRPAVFNADRDEWLFTPKKHAETRKMGFVRDLRERFANVVNEEFERAGLRRRWDPRTYREMGIDKQPGEHLGGAAHALERSGVVTTRGSRNVGREMEFGLVRLMVREGWVADRDLRSIRAGLAAADDLDGASYLHARKAVDRMFEAATEMAAASKVRTETSARLEWGDIRRESMTRRPRALANKGRDDDLRDEAASLVPEINGYWRGDMRSRRDAALAADKGYQKAKRELAASQRNIEAERLFLRRMQTKTLLDDVMARGAPRDASAETKDTRRLEDRLRRLQAERGGIERSVVGTARMLELPVKAADLPKRSVRRALRNRLRSLAEHHGGEGVVSDRGQDAVAEDSPATPPTANLRTALAGLHSLDSLDDVMRRIRALQGSLRLREAARARRDEVVGDAAARDGAQTIRFAKVVGGLRRRLDAIDKQILANPTASAVASRRGLSNRLLKEGEIERRRRRPQRDRGRDD